MHKETKQMRGGGERQKKRIKDNVWESHSQRAERWITDCLNICACLEAGIKRRLFGCFLVSVGGQFSQQTALVCPYLQQCPSYQVSSLPCKILPAFSKAKATAAYKLKAAHTFSVFLILYRMTFCSMFIFWSFAVLGRPGCTCSDGAPDHQWCAGKLLPGEDGVPALHRQLQPSRAVHLETWERAHRTEQGQWSGHLRTPLHSGTHTHTHTV